jgi:hypothetical protein
MVRHSTENSTKKDWSHECIQASTRSSSRSISAAGAVRCSSSGARCQRKRCIGWIRGSGRSLRCASARYERHAPSGPEGTHAAVGLQPVHLYPWQQHRDLLRLSSSGRVLAINWRGLANGVGTDPRARANRCRGCRFSNATSTSGARSRLRRPGARRGNAFDTAFKDHVDWLDLRSERR